jgi:hypothetical protein
MGNEDAGTIAERAANGFWPTKDSDDACAADLTNRTDVSGSHAAEPGINGRLEPQGGQCGLDNSERKNFEC